VPIPDKKIPTQSAERLLRSETNREVGLGDLAPAESGERYVAEGLVHLSSRYIDLLRNAPGNASVRLRFRGPTDPVVITDGKESVGVVMPVVPPKAGR
jgi:hypothetical protein